MRKFGNSELSTKPTNYDNWDRIIVIGFHVKLSWVLNLRWSIEKVNMAYTNFMSYIYL